MLARTLFRARKRLLPLAGSAASFKPLRFRSGGM
jgi:hypothetical protein